VPDFHPDLARGRFIPPFAVGPRSLGLFRRLRSRPPAAPPDVLVREVAAAPGVTMRVHRPRTLTGPAPALLWLHGGGFVFGAPEQDDAANTALARELGITVAAVRYRLAPDHPAPAAVEDAHAGLLALAEQEHVDPRRIAVGGASAGGGLAACLAQHAHDRSEVRPVFQLLRYPMLDDRTVLRTDLDVRGVRVWTPRSNRFGWTSYLGGPPGAPDVPPYAAAARRADLGGLPPAWIGVGTLDLFHAEDLAYAERLRGAGVACEVVEVPGAFHAFDALFPRAGVVRDFRAREVAALRTALAG
jgi:acetyl esterase/lipase